jgi:hypothetical protein
LWEFDPGIFFFWDLNVIFVYLDFKLLVASAVVFATHTFFGPKKMNFFEIIQIFTKFSSDVCTEERSWTKLITQGTAPPGTYGHRYEKISPQPLPSLPPP